MCILKGKLTYQVGFIGLKMMILMIMLLFTSNAVTGRPKSNKFIYI